MGQRYILDTNTVIDYVGELLPEQAALAVDSVINDELNVSVIAYIEVLGYGDKPESMKRLQDFLDLAFIYYVDMAIAKQAIRIRKKYKIKLPDAIIAATAMVHDLTLLTRNVNDFKKIEGLDFANPYEL
jgi:predicted nucleic acid-binding protein